MLLSRSCQYGIRALLYVAIESDKSKNTDLIKITEAMDISRPHLAKIMQDLTKRGLVRSSKRPNGGFFMTWKEKSKTLLDVIDSIDSLRYVKQCSLGLEECDDSNACPLHAEIIKVREIMMKAIGKQSIENIAQKIKKGEFIIALK